MPSPCNSISGSPLLCTKIAPKTPGTPSRICCASMKRTAWTRTGILPLHADTLIRPHPLVVSTAPLVPKLVRRFPCSPARPSKELQLIVFLAHMPQTRIGRAPQGPRIRPQPTGVSTENLLPAPSFTELKLGFFTSEPPSPGRPPTWQSQHS